jgi:hypothetical protein
MHIDLGLIECIYLESAMLPESPFIPCKFYFIRSFEEKKIFFLAFRSIHENGQLERMYELVSQWKGRKFTK